VPPCRLPRKATRVYQVVVFTATSELSYRATVISARATHHPVTRGHKYWTVRPRRTASHWIATSLQRHISAPATHRSRNH